MMYNQIPLYPTVIKIPECGESEFSETDDTKLAKFREEIFYVRASEQRDEKAVERVWKSYVERYGN